jgi:hypothetical protein
MSATFTSAFLGITFASGKTMGNVFNATGSGAVLALTRAICLNNQTAGVTGVLTTMELRRITASSGGTTVTPQKHDTSSASLPAQVTSASGSTDTSSDTFRRFMWSNDEPAVSSATNDELECMVPLNEIWNSAINDAAVEHLVMREVQGAAIRQSGTSAVGILDTFLEFIRVS